MYSFFFFLSTSPTPIALHRVLRFWEDLVSLLQKTLKPRVTFTSEVRVFWSLRIGPHPYCGNGEALEQDAQRSFGCLIPGGVQCQVGWDFEYPDLVGGIPAHGRGLGTRWPLKSIPAQTILWFCEIVQLIRMLANSKIVISENLGA